MNDLVPFLLALRVIDPDLQAEVGLDERDQHLKTITESNARLMVRVGPRAGSRGMLIGLDDDDMKLDAGARAEAVHKTYLEMLSLYAAPHRPVTPPDGISRVSLPLKGAQIYAGCRANDDGDCKWSECPQLRDGEPAKSKRHCPLDNAAEIEA